MKIPKLLTLVSTEVVKQRDWTRQYWVNGRREIDWGRRLIHYKIWHLGKIKIFWIKVDEEEVPKDALIDMGCFGQTEWQSKFKNLITTQNSSLA